MGQWSRFFDTFEEPLSQGKPHIFPIAYEALIF